MATVIVITGYNFQHWFNSFCNSQRYDVSASVSVDGMCQYFETCGHVQVSFQQRIHPQKLRTRDQTMHMVFQSNLL